MGWVFVLGLFKVEGSGFKVHFFVGGLGSRVDNHNRRKYGPANPGVLVCRAYTPTTLQAQSKGPYLGPSFSGKGPY